MTTIERINVPIMTIVNDELKKECRKLYLSGLSYKQIEKLKKVSRSNLSYWCRDIVRPAPPKKIPVVKPKAVSTKPSIDTVAVLDLWAKGIHRSDIAKQFDVNENAIQKIVAGVKRKMSFPDRVSTVPLGEGPFKDWRLYFSHDRYGHKTVNLVHQHTKERMGMRYARYIMSVHLDRILTKFEVVMYKEDGVDEIDNLYIKTLSSPMVGDDLRLTKPCLHCKTLFTAQKYRAKYCSLKCKSDARNLIHRPDRICRGCKSEFDAPSKSQRYCGEECKTKYGAPKHGRKTQSPRKKKAQVEKVECVVCEMKFIPDSPDREVCYSQHCNDIIAQEDEE